MSPKSGHTVEARATAHANAKAKVRPTTIDECLAPLPAAQRGAIVRTLVRARIKSIV